MFQYFEAARVGGWLDKTSTQTRRHGAFSELFFDPIQKHQRNTPKREVWFALLRAHLREKWRWPKASQLLSDAESISDLTQYEVVNQCLT